MTERLDRRSFVRLLGSGAAAAATFSFGPQLAFGKSRAPSVLRRDSARVFDLSVASGDPSTTGAVLWTHVAESVFAPATPMWVQVSTLESFASLVFEAELSVSSIASSDHCVSVALSGVLEPGKRYYYRFIYGDTVSRVGRCRTLPTGSPSALKLAVLTCQDYTNGYYGVFRHLAADDSVDFVVHLGDFIYESVGDPRFQDMALPERWLYLPSGSSVAMDLRDYRYLYRSYRSDADLQRALEKHTFIITSDDHETSNDCYWDYAKDTLGAPDHPYVADPQALRGLKLASQRAWLEYVPSRVVANEGETHPHDYTSIFRAFDFGDLARISMLDTRTYRSAHPCGEGDVLERYLPIGCKGQYATREQTLLGARQKPWLESQLTSSRSVWNLLGNQTLVAPLKLGYGSRPLPINVDAWDGYQTERRWLLDLLKQAKIQNAVVLTGDMHSYIASQLLYQFDSLNPLDVGNILGTELMTPAVTSSNLLETLSAQLGGSSGSQQLLDGLSEAAVRINNPHIKFFDSAHYGYSTLELRRDRFDWTAYAIDKDLPADQARVSVLTRLRKYTWWPWLV